jgi:transposase
MPVDLEQLKQLYESGQSLEQCCMVVGLKSPGSVLKRFRRHGIPTRSVAQSAQRRSLILPQEEIAEMYADGLSCRDIAKICGCSAKSIHKYLKIWNISIRKPSEAIALARESKLDDYAKKQIIELRFTHKIKYKEISERLGISCGAIGQFCRKWKEEEV